MMFLHDGCQGTYIGLGISSDIKFIPMSDAIYLGSLYSAKYSYMFLLGYQFWTPCPFLPLGTYCGSLHYNNSAC